MKENTSMAEIFKRGTERISELMKDPERLYQEVYKKEIINAKKAGFQGWYCIGRVLGDNLIFTLHNKVLEREIILRILLDSDFKEDKEFFDNMVSHLLKTKCKLTEGILEEIKNIEK